MSLARILGFRHGWGVYVDLYLTRGSLLVAVTDLAAVAVAVVEGVVVGF